MPDADAPSGAGSDRLPQQALWELIRGIRYGMLATIGPDGLTRASPMTTLNRQIDEDASLWFFVSADGDTAADVQRDPRVHVTYADPAEDHYVSVAGRARIVDQPRRRHALWTPQARAWFDGPDDPQLALLEVRIELAEYWDVHASKIVQRLHIARSRVTGDAPKSRAEHREVDFRRPR